MLAKSSRLPSSRPSGRYAAISDQTAPRSGKAQKIIAAWFSLQNDPGADLTTARDTVQWMKGQLEATLKTWKEYAASDQYKYEKKSIEQNRIAIAKKALKLISDVEKGQSLTHEKLFELMFLYAEALHDLQHPRIMAPLMALPRQLTQGLLDSYFPEIAFIPTHENLGVRDFNDASPYPIAFCGLLDRTAGNPPVNYDGRRAFNVMTFLEHDLAHGRTILRQFLKGIGLMDSRLDPTTDSRAAVRSRVRREVARRSAFYSEFRKYVSAVPDAQTQGAMDLIWFVAFHESSKDYAPSTFLDFIRSAYKPTGRIGTKSRRFKVETIMKRINDPTDFGAECHYSEKTIRAALVQMEKFLLAPELSKVERRNWR